MKFNKEELQQKANELLTIKSLANYYKCSSSIIRYWVNKLNITIPLDSHAKNEIGNTYGSLKVIGLDSVNERGEVIWKCKCECSREVTRIGTELRRSRNNNPKCEECAKEQMSKVKLIDYTGKKINNLYVIKRYGVTNSLSCSATWLCQCDCGNTIIVSSSALPKQVSCGCIKSHGEYFINLILHDHNIQYKSQYTFNNFKTNKNRNYRFDFGVLNNNKLLFLIEYQGYQHYYFKNSHPYYNEQNFKQLVQRDKDKVNYCEQNNIPLCRIPYWYNTYDKIEKYLFNFIQENNILIDW